MTERWVDMLAELDEIQRRLAGPGLTPADVGMLTQRAEELYAMASRELLRSRPQTNQVPVRRVTQLLPERPGSTLRSVSNE
jgi:hypothetical protein